MRLPLVTRGEACRPRLLAWGGGGGGTGGWPVLGADQHLTIWESEQRTIRASRTPCDQACWGGPEEGAGVPELGLEDPAPAWQHAPLCPARRLRSLSG